MPSMIFRSHRASEMSCGRGAVRRRARSCKNETTLLEQAMARRSCAAAAGRAFLVTGALGLRPLYLCLYSLLYLYHGTLLERVLFNSLGPIGERKCKGCGVHRLSRDLLSPTGRIYNPLGRVHAPFSRDATRITQQPMYYRYILLVCLPLL